MQMVRYHNLPNLEFPEYQINFVLHTFLTIIKDPNQQNMELCINTILTLNPLTWKIWCAPNNTSRWQMGFNSAFKGFKFVAIFQFRLKSSNVKERRRQKCYVLITFPNLFHFSIELFTIPTTRYIRGRKWYFCQD